MGLLYFFTGRVRYLEERKTPRQPCGSNEFLSSLYAFSLSSQINLLAQHRSYFSLLLSCLLLSLARAHSTFMLLWLKVKKTAQNLHISYWVKPWRNESPVFLGAQVQARWL